jgi:CelD/BcsL family acetyltransferase involved in cellulose biosynthesis
MTSVRKPAHRLSVEDVYAESEFARLQEPWNALVSRSKAPGFLRHEWLTAAWAWCRLSKREMWILCIYEGTVLVGALPMLRPFRMPSGEQRLQFLDVPDAQWCDALIDPALGHDVADSMIAGLLDATHRWDVLRLQRLPSNSMVERWLLPALAARGLQARFETVAVNRSVDLRATWQDYHSSLSRRTKKAYNLSSNRIARAGGARVEWITADNCTLENAQSLLDAVTSISSQSWKRATGSSLDCEGPTHFFGSLTASACREGWLSVFILRIGDEAAAMEYQLNFDGCVYALRADYKESFAALSPGTYLNFHLLKRLFESGTFRAYYMGTGLNPYKARWSPEGEKVHAMTLFAPTVRGRVGHLWSQAKPTLRKVKAALQLGR